MADLSTISIIIAASSVVIGVIYYILQLRHQAKNRDTQLIISLCSTLERFEFQEALSKINGLDTDNGDEIENACSLPVLLTVSNYFERAGVMVNRGLLKSDLVYDLLPPVTLMWRKILPWVMAFRTRENNPHLFEWVEYLYDEMRKREEKLYPT